MSSQPVEQRRASWDDALGARVVRRMPLLYDDGADARLDRPAHVRGASSLVRVPGGIAVVQDDANFIALLDPSLEKVTALTLPAGAGGLRQFDDLRGNKADRWDLESAVSVEDESGRVVLVAFGSGSAAPREHVVLVDGWEEGPPAARVVRASRLYGMLRRTATFAGSELNIEGAVRLGETIRLFNRGNGAPRGELEPVNATCDLRLASLLAHLRAPLEDNPPTPHSVVGYDLGSLGGLALGFTDAARWGGSILYAAAAEDSPDATRDGPVSGAVIGLIDASGSVRQTLLRDATGATLAVKVEGLLVPERPGDPVLVVVDPDDARAPAELCEVELRGPWRSSPSTLGGGQSPV